MMPRSFALAIACFGLIACGDSAPPPAAPTSAAVANAAPTTPAPPAPSPPHADGTLIARKVLFGNPDHAAPRVSPDGRRILFIAPDQGVLNAWVAPASDPTAAKVVTHERTRPVREVRWAETSEHVLYQNDKGGDENFHVFVVDLKTGQEKDLTPYDGVRTDLQDTFDKHPTTLFVQMNKRDKNWMDPALIDIKTGKVTVLYENDGYQDFLLDKDAKLRLGQKYNADGSREIFLRAGAGKKAEWKSFIKIGREDSTTTEPRWFNRDGKTLYMSDSRDRDTAAVVAVEVGSGKRTVLFEDPKSDVQGDIVDPKTMKPLAVMTNRERRVWHALDKSVQGDLDALARVAKGDITVLSQSHDGRKWTVSFLKDDGPTAFYLWDRNTKHASYIFSDRKDLQGVELAPMHPVVIAARDGLELVSYLTLPRSVDPKETGKPSKPVPMVLLVHGGPWGRDQWGLNASHQWLANRGYAVLSVNFRASTGFGKKFVNAGDREWGRKMHDDLLDAVKWAVDGKVADPKKVAIMGGSYGGYATLAGLTFTPDVFACGVDIVGPSNLVTLLHSIPPYWSAIFNDFVMRIGDPRTDEGKQFLASRSPLSQVDAIKKPLLIGQGANDPRVKQAESDQIVKAMQAKGLPVTYVLFPDEGHGFQRPENRLSFFAVTEVFLAEHLGGSYQPYEGGGDDFQGSSMQVPAGASSVYGLEAALSKKR
ncbi:S9 family peptidase [Pendulispora rubella]|uniref:S9 family peptidase n=1 Tax=Pendulispora rubella TaxID=2741070 RepID=A0ABZ2LD54_9BACT